MPLVWMSRSAMPAALIAATTLAICSALARIAALASAAWVTTPVEIVAMFGVRLASEVANRDPQAAAKMFDELAADRSVGAAEQDLARIRAAQLLLESTSYPNMKERLEAAAAPGATFRHTARELLALSAWRANDAAAKRQWLDLIANDGETPPSLRSRAEALQALLPPVAKS